MPTYNQFHYLNRILTRLKDWSSVKQIQLQAHVRLANYSVYGYRRDEG